MLWAFGPEALERYATPIGIGLALLLILLVPSLRRGLLRDFRKGSEAGKRARLRRQEQERPEQVAAPTLSAPPEEILDLQPTQPLQWLPVEEDEEEVADAIILEDIVEAQVVEPAKPDTSLEPLPVDPPESAPRAPEKPATPEPQKQTTDEPGWPRLQLDDDEDPWGPPSRRGRS